MAIGQSKYNAELTEACAKVGATSGILIIIDGAQGPGFACQATLPVLVTLPDMLRDVAGQIEADLKKGIL